MVPLCEYQGGPSHSSVALAASQRGGGAAIFHQAEWDVAAEPYWKRSPRPPEGSHALCRRYDCNAMEQSHQGALCLKALKSCTLLWARDDRMEVCAVCCNSATMAFFLFLFKHFQCLGFLSPQFFCHPAKCCSHPGIVHNLISLHYCFSLNYVAPGSLMKLTNTVMNHQLLTQGQL